LNQPCGHFPFISSILYDYEMSDIISFLMEAAGWWHAGFDNDQTRSHTRPKNKATLERKTEGSILLAG
jgi:hypothetical protein